MKILVLNCGSSTIKFRVFEMKNQTELASGVVENIGEEMSRMRYEALDKPRHIYTEIVANAKVAMELIVEELTSPQYGVLRSMDQIAGVGHRLVNGGEEYANSVIIDNQVIKYLMDHYELAPLHNPAALAGINACLEEIPGVTNVAVFDTAFHQTMRKEAYLYGLPYDYYEKYQVRRYGFHGTSHKYVCERAAALMDQPVTDIKMITCHLGGGSSVCAIKNGVSVDTSMGFSPLSGVMMGTRCGDVDPAVVTYLMEKEHLTAEEVISVMNKKSGLLGISGISNDVRSLNVASERGNDRAFLALKMFARRVKGFIGQYYAYLNGIDALVFTAGIGENDYQIRDMICEKLDSMGIRLDPKKNRVAMTGEDFEIGAEDAPVRVFVVHTNEELEIAKDTFRLIGGRLSTHSLALDF